MVSVRNKIVKKMAKIEGKNRGWTSSTKFFKLENLPNTLYNLHRF